MNLITILFKVLIQHVRVTAALQSGLSRNSLRSCIGYGEKSYAQHPDYAQCGR